MADKTGKKDEILEMAHLLTNGMNKFGEFLIQSAAEIHAVLAARDEAEDGDEDAEGDEAAVPKDDLQDELQDELETRVEPAEEWAGAAENCPGAVAPTWLRRSPR